MPQPLRIVFAGTPEFAAEHLKALLTTAHTLLAVYTQPDRPAGRGQKSTPSPVKQLAQQHQIPVLQPATLRDPAAQAELAALRPDVLIVVAYGLILPQAVLDIPRLGCINSHASLLPRWRGAAPIQRAIEAGDAETGITLMQMEAGLDTGPMLLKAHTPITEQDTGGVLHDRLAQLGSQLLLEGVQALAGNGLSPEPQNDALATYAHKLTKEEAELTWSQPAAELARRIRAFHPWPMAYTKWPHGILKIHAAHVTEGSGPAGCILAANKEGLTVACGTGALLLKILQLPGGKPLPFADLYNSRRELFIPGGVLGL